MRALIIQHDHVSPPGPVAERLAQHGIEIVLHPVVPKAKFENPGVETEFPPAEAFDLIVVMGSPWSAYDFDLIGSWLRPEMDLLRDADTANVGVLGICFGGQLLAQTFGGSVALAPHKEIGWFSIETDRPELVPTGPWFQWHQDHWAVPPEAVEIARNSSASQAFVLRRHLAVQFHPELTAHMLKLWLSNGGDEIARAEGLDPDELIAQTEAHEAESEKRAYALIDAFIASQSAKA